MTARARLFKARQTADKARAAAASTVNTFRPRKEERGTFVFLAKPSSAELRQIKKAGKRPPKYVRVPAGTGRKAYAVYVTKTGKKKLVPDKPKNLRTMAERLVKSDRPELKPGSPAWEKEVVIRERLAKIRSKGVPAYTKPRNLDLFAAGKGSKRAAEDFYRGRRQRVFAPGQLPEFKARGKGAVDFEKISAGVARSLFAVWSRSRGRDVDLLVEWRAVVKEADGSAHRLTGMNSFKARFNQEFDVAGFKKFAFLTIYAKLAAQLSQKDLVTGGSAGYVQRLPANRGQADRRQWLDARGERWEKNEFSEVRLVEFTFDVTETLLDRD